MEQYNNTEEKEIDLKELWYLFISNIKFIAIIVLICMIIATTISFFILDKQYESYSTLMLGKAGGSNKENAQEITYNDVLLNQQLVPTYSEIAKSRNVTEKVISNLKLKLTSEALGNMIAVSTVNDTEIIKITVTHTDPIIAAKIANETSSVFMIYVADLMKIDNINIIDVAEANPNPISPNTKMNIAISAVLGLMIGIFIIFIKEYLNTKIKSPKDVEAISKYPILAVIPESKNLA